jgi:RNA polymerase sigma factor (sigma-70 family)
MTDTKPVDQQASEIRWIAEAQKGDLDAFNRLVMLHQDRVFNTTYRILGSYDEAEDAAQKTFISAYQNIRSFRGGSFKAWLLRSAVNACYDELRKSKRHPSISIDDDTKDDAADLSERGLPDQTPSPQNISEMRELQQAVQYCLGELPPDFRAVAVLADVDELEYEEISRITGNPLGTIKSRLARARQKLRGCLEDFWELLPPAIRQKYEGVR